MAIELCFCLRTQLLLLFGRGGCSLFSPVPGSLRMDSSIVCDPCAIQILAYNTNQLTEQPCHLGYSNKISNNDSIKYKQFPRMPREMYPGFVHYVECTRLFLSHLKNGDKRQVNFLIPLWSQSHKNMSLIPTPTFPTIQMHVHTHVPAHTLHTHTLHTHTHTHS